MVLRLNETQDRPERVRTILGIDIRVDLLGVAARPAGAACQARHRSE